MATLPKVISPLVSLGEWGGVELMLVSVEAWPDEVVVRMRGLPNDVTAELETDFGEALEAWHRAGRGDSPPRQPAEWVFPLDVEVADDLGTAYASHSSSRGGSGTMFRADYVFTPGPPPAVASLTVRVGGADGVDTRIDLTASA
jgi:hypothetical protein